MYSQVLKLRATVAVSVVLSLGGTLAMFAAEWTSGKVWPEPKVVDPGAPGGHPADAIVLFDGKDMSAFNNADKWEVKNGVVTAGGNDITSKQEFGDCQIHIEFATPAEVKGKSQGRGNSGVFLADRYEVQILDSYNNPTYFDGQCGAIYKQHPPLANVCRKPGEWQTYDIVFTAPKFDEKGNCLQPAYVTVLQNGVVVQDHFAIEGASSFNHPPDNSAYSGRAPLRLQYHHNPVQFRNIWVREITQPTFTKE